MMTGPMCLNVKKSLQQHVSDAGGGEQQVYLAPPRLRTSKSPGSHYQASSNPTMLSMRIPHQPCTNSTIIRPCDVMIPIDYVYTSKPLLGPL